MTDYTAWWDARWASVPDELKAKIVAHLRASLDADAVRQIRAEIAKHGRYEWIHVSGEHHFFGRSVRNLLRQAVRDDELPDAPYDWLLVEGKVPMVRNWDDYYVQAVEAAVAEDQP